MHLHNRLIRICRRQLSNGHAVLNLDKKRTIDFRFVPLSHENVEKCLELNNLAYSRESNIDSPSAIASGASPQQVYDIYKPIFYDNLYGATSFVLINNENEDIVGYSVNCDYNQCKYDCYGNYENEWQIFFHKMIDYFTLSRTKWPADNDFIHSIEEINNNQGIRIEAQSTVTNPKYRRMGVHYYMKLVLGYLMFVKNDYCYYTSIANSEIPMKTFIKAFGNENLIYLAKFEYKEFFDYCDINNIKYDTSQKNRLNQALQLHPWRYYVMLNKHSKIYEKTLLPKILNFYQANKSQFDMYDNMLAHACQESSHLESPL